MKINKKIKVINKEMLRYLGIKSGEVVIYATTSTRLLRRMSRGFAVTKHFLELT